MGAKAQLDIDAATIDPKRRQLIEALSALATPELSHLHPTARLQIGALLQQLQPSDEELFQHALAKLIIKTPVADAVREDKLQQLAKMDPLDYEQCREEMAEQLGLKRISILDKEVAKRRPHSDIATGGRPIELRNPKPWDSPVNGAELLNTMRSLIVRYVVLPAGADVVLALWALHTYALDAAEHSPRLGIVSPEKRCGKTLVLDLLDVLSLRPVSAANITTAAVFRTIEAYRPALLIDEADTFLPDNHDLRGVLDSGFQRSKAFVMRLVGEDHAPAQFSTWCPVAIALIGSLPSTLQDRSILISMRRKTKTERVERARHSHLVTEGERYQRQAARWVADHMDVLMKADPQMPLGLNDRAADCWRPLLAIADEAGGEWGTLARGAALVLSQDRDEGISVQLLADVRSIFTKLRRDALFSETLAAELGKMEERSWSEWRNGQPITKAQLAKRLAPFGVSPHSVRVRNRTGKGYKLEWFADAFTRYLPSRNVTTSQPTPDVDSRSVSKRHNNENVTFRNGRKPTPDVGCDVVTFQKGGGGRK